MDQGWHSSPCAPVDGGDALVDDIIQIAESVNVIGEYRLTQRKECLNLVRRLSFFLPFLEEIKRRSSTEAAPIPKSAVVCLTKLKKAFKCAKKFLKLCQSGSKIFLAIESEAMMVRSQGVYEKICQALDGMPYEELGISEEEQEQVELLHKQLRKAKRRTDTQDIELIMDLMVVLSTNNDRNADIASIERLSNKLHLHTPEELQQETLAIQKLVKERKGRSAESTEQIINLLNKFKRVAGVPEDDLFHVTTASKPLAKINPVVIPKEFLCPITMEIMTDPVIVATGQTYERDNIEKWLASDRRTCPKTGKVLERDSIEEWLASDRRTCPKTGKVLEHVLLTPNVALKNLIVQWCEKNNYHPSKKRENVSAAEAAPCSADDISSLVEKLSSSNSDELRKAVTTIRLLSKESPENRTLIANVGGIRPLLRLLSYRDSSIQEQSVTAILNLSIDKTNKQLISKEDVALPAIIEILRKGTVGAKENSAAALFSLSMINENKTRIGELNGIPPLVDLLKTGTARGKKDAMTALFNLCLSPSNKDGAIEAGIVPPLLRVLDDPHLDMINETLSTLLILASSSKGRRELGQLPFIGRLVKFIGDGTPKNRECATAVLLELGSNNSNLILAALQYGVYEALVEVCKNGTERGQRKANSLLKLMSKAEQIP
ncbi:U-box domain-containing protein 15 [Andrographis paniculata]|uniref:U-box domain-containing protein 15 n=1 Tax=Andrographis paniculata TaxID=175694 RepID=UPI0021E95917|nr:U-box domain-containing protein 15 [Andrographis paniculata]